MRGSVPLSTSSRLRPRPGCHARENRAQPVPRARPLQEVDGGDALAVDARVVGDQSSAETLHQVDRGPRAKPRCRGGVSPATCAAVPQEASKAVSRPPRTIRLAPRSTVPATTRPAPTRDCRILEETITLRQSSIPAVPWVVAGCQLRPGGRSRQPVLALNSRATSGSRRAPPLHTAGLASVLALVPIVVSCKHRAVWPWRAPSRPRRRRLRARKPPLRLSTRLLLRPTDRLRLPRPRIPPRRRPPWRLRPRARPESPTNHRTPVLRPPQ